MSALNQKTVKQPINFTGIGLHSGKLTEICIKPSEPDTGKELSKNLKKNHRMF